MTSILVYEPLSAGDPATTRALGRGSPAHVDMLAAGRAMRDAVVADLAALPGVRVTVTTGLQEAGHAAQASAVSQGPDEDAMSFVRREARRHDLCWVIAPESDGLLLELHDAVGTSRWIGCTAEAIRLAASKRATSAALARAGIATPLAFSPGDAWIVKPDDGAGTLDTRRHATRAAAAADLRQRRLAGQRALSQPFVSGEPLSIALVVGPVLARPVAFNRQQVHVDAAGWLHDQGVQPAAVHAADPRVPALQALGREVAAALPGLRGYVGIDVVWNERKGPVVIEVNPRVTCAYVGLSALLQRNLSADILAAHARPGVREVAGHVAA